MTTPQTHTRNSSLQDLVELLRTNHARKVDVVAPVSKIRSEMGLIRVEGADAEITLDGVTTTDGTYRPTAVFDGGLADRLGIPPGYLAKLRSHNIGLYDQNVNGWLQHPTLAGRNYLIRGFKADGPEGTPEIGVGRAFLSDSYKPIDDLDVLMTVLSAVQDAGVEIQIVGCSLTDRRMYVRVKCESVYANAIDLVRNYRSPFGGGTGVDLPLAFAGFEIGNSEVGHGRFSIAPRVELQACGNGMVRRVDAFEAQHLGQKLEVGTIRWSEETQAKNLELIRSKTVDAVRTFLSREYVEQFLVRATAGAETKIAKPEETIRKVATQLRYSEDQQDAILAMFIKGGDLTAGGVMHAVTAAAQAEADADRAAEMEGDALRALQLAVTLA